MSKFVTPQYTSTASKMELAAATDAEEEEEEEDVQNSYNAKPNTTKNAQTKQKKHPNSIHINGMVTNKYT